MNPSSARVALPFVSVIVPCRNEAEYIGGCLRSLLEGDYPQDRFEVIVSDGMSADGTRELVRTMATADSRVRLVDNPQKVTPAALNAAIRVSRGSIIVRMDAHAEVASSYVRRCVETLIESGADNVGGVMHTLPRGNGLWARAIACAISHPFGVGNSRFRIHSASPVWVDTVFGGCYRKEVFEKVGLFNERLARGQDMEFNLRLRRHGGRILLDPSIESRYFARSDMGSFVRHNWSNGVWAILPFAWSDGSPVAARHLVPAAFAILLLVGAGLGGLLGKLWLACALPALYFASAIVAAGHASMRRRDAGLFATLPICFVALHIPYGFGSLWGGGCLGGIAAQDGRLAKRICDIAGAASALAIGMPVMLLAALSVKLEDGGPVLYRGVRVGRRGERFEMLKFRTMVVDAEKLGGSSTADDDGRITATGRVLRRWKFDELPQLWNVLIGDMSLVGPRPQVERDVAKYTGAELPILSVRPGITDWSSIKFRNEGEILRGKADPDAAYIELIRPEKIRLQLRYIRRRSFWVDVKILFSTILALFGKEVDIA